jgi:hypothetical protein
MRFVSLALAGVRPGRHQSREGAFRELARLISAPEVYSARRPTQVAGGTATSDTDGRPRSKSPASTADDLGERQRFLASDPGTDALAWNA